MRILREIADDMEGWEEKGEEKEEEDGDGLRLGAGSSSSWAAKWG